MALDAKETRSKRQNTTGNVPAGSFLILDWARKRGRRKLGIPGFGRTSMIKNIPWNYGVGSHSSHICESNCVHYTILSSETVFCLGYIVLLYHDVF